MHEVLVNSLGGLSLPRKSVVRLTDRPDMTLDVYRGRKATMQCNNALNSVSPGQSASLFILGSALEFISTCIYKFTRQIVTDNIFDLMMS